MTADFTERIRRRDGCCLYGLVAQDGCVGMLEAHHIDFRSQVVDNSDQNGILLCWKHHIQAQSHRVTREQLHAVLTRFYHYAYENETSEEE